MTTAFEPALTSAGLIAISSAWALFLGRRTRSAQLRREARMREATSLLALHIGALEALDDPEVPPLLRGLALEISGLLHDADQVSYLAEAARLRAQERTRRPEGLPPSVAQDGVVGLRAEALRLRAKRPDLLEALEQCIVAGTLSFGRRHPDLAAALGLDAAQVIASPVAEARRVIRSARDMIRAGGFGAALR